MADCNNIYKRLLFIKVWKTYDCLSKSSVVCPFF